MDPSDAMQYNLILGGIIVFALLSAFFGKWVSVKVFMSISRRLHHSLVRRVLQTSIVFFEENTQGRILTRFSVDTATMDQIVFGFLEMADYIVKCLLSVVIIIMMSPIILVVAVLSLIYLISIRRINLIVTKDTIRLKYSLMGPVNSLIQDAVNGLPTLRCLGQQAHFL